MIDFETIDAVIFDLDGTLVDSMWMWKKIDQEYLGQYGIELPPSLQNDIAGMSFTETAIYFQQVFPIPESLEQMKDTWHRMAEDKYRCEVPLKKGALAYLQTLKRYKIKLGLATSNSIYLVNTVLQSLGILNLFDSIHTACEVESGKPAPDIYLLVASDLQVTPSRCLVHEDIPQGLLAGIRAGMHTCGVYDDDSSEKEQQMRELAEKYIYDYEDIRKELEYSKENTI